jgi:hypothetical protein
MDIQCNNCQAYLNIREVVTGCTECKELLKPKTKNMKATLDNFLVKWDGNSPIWKEFIEWLNKDMNNNLFSGDMEDRYYGRVEGKRRCPESHLLIDAINTPIISLEQWKELLTKTEKMDNFKKGDKVFVAPYGWVEFISQQEDSNICMVVRNENAFNVDIRLVSFIKYKLEGFTQERPFTPEVGEYYFFWNEETKNDDCVGYGRLKQISNNINFPYFFGTKYFQFCSETNPLS